VIYEGCNIENASYGATLCAERVALAAMVGRGEQNWTHIAIATDADPPASPCGLCLQMLVEFAEDGAIFLAGSATVTRRMLRELLPAPFVLR
jgi:cytidine deaminase